MVIAAEINNRPGPWEPVVCGPWVAGTGPTNSLSVHPLSVAPSQPKHRETYMYTEYTQQHIQWVHSVTQQSTHTLCTLEIHFKQTPSILSNFM